MAKKKHFTADEIMQYISFRISQARAEEDYETVIFFRRLGVSVIKTMYEDTRPLTPEILSEQGWDNLVLTKTEKVFKKSVFDSSVKLTSWVKVTLHPLCEKIKIDFCDKNATGEIFTKLITVGEFNDLLDIVGLQQFKIKII